MTDDEMFAEMEVDVKMGLTDTLAVQLVDLLEFTAQHTELTDEVAEQFDVKMREAVWTFSCLSNFTVSPDAAVASIGAMGSIVLRILAANK